MSLADSHNPRVGDAIPRTSRPVAEQSILAEDVWLHYDTAIRLGTLLFAFGLVKKGR